MRKSAEWLIGAGCLVCAAAAFSYPFVKEYLPVSRKVTSLKAAKTTSTVSRLTFTADFNFRMVSLSSVFVEFNGSGTETESVSAEVKSSTLLSSEVSFTTMDFSFFSLGADEAMSSQSVVVTGFSDGSGKKHSVSESATAYFFMSSYLSSGQAEANGKTLSEKEDNPFSAYASSLVFQPSFSHSSDLTVTGYTASLCFSDEPLITAEADGEEETEFDLTGHEAALMMSDESVSGFTVRIDEVRASSGTGTEASASLGTEYGFRISEASRMSLTRDFSSFGSVCFSLPEASYGLASGADSLYGEIDGCSFIAAKTSEHNFCMNPVGALGLKDHDVVSESYSISIESVSLAGTETPVRPFGITLGITDKSYELSGASESFFITGLGESASSAAYNTIVLSMGTSGSIITGSGEYTCQEFSEGFAGICASCLSYSQKDSGLYQIQCALAYWHEMDFASGNGSKALRFSHSGTYVLSGSGCYAWNIAEAGKSNPFSSLSQTSCSSFSVVSASDDALCLVSDALSYYKENGAYGNASDEALLSLLSVSSESVSFLSVGSSSESGKASFEASAGQSVLSWSFDYSCVFCCFPSPSFGLVLSDGTVCSSWLGSAVFGTVGETFAPAVSAASLTWSSGYEGIASGTPLYILAASSEDGSESSGTESWSSYASGCELFPFETLGLELSGDSYIGASFSVGSLAEGGEVRAEWSSGVSDGFVLDAVLGLSEGRISVSSASWSVLGGKYSGEAKGLSEDFDTASLGLAEGDVPLFIGSAENKIGDVISMGVSEVEESIILGKTKYKYLMDSSLADLDYTALLDGALTSLFVCKTDSEFSYYLQGKQSGSIIFERKFDSIFYESGLECSGSVLYVKVL